MSSSLCVRSDPRFFTLVENMGSALILHSRTILGPRRGVVPSCALSYVCVDQTAVAEVGVMNRSQGSLLWDNHYFTFTFGTDGTWTDGVM